MSSLCAGARLCEEKSVMALAIEGPALVRLAYNGWFHPTTFKIRSPMNRGRPREFDVPTALRSAMLVFWKKGFRHTSIEDLTTAMGVSRPSMYAAFGNKDDVFRAALDQYVEDHGKKINALLSGEAKLVHEIDAFLRESVCCFTDKQLPGGCLIANHASDGELHEDVRERLLKLSALTEKSLAARYQMAFTRGEVASEHSARSMASLTYCLLSGLSQASRMGASRRKLNGIVDSFMAGQIELLDELE